MSIKSTAGPLHPANSHLERRLVECLSTLGLPPADLSRAYNDLLDVVNQSGLGDGDDATKSVDWGEMAPDQLALEVEISWLALQRSLCHLEPGTRVAQLRKWLDEVALPLALSRRADIAEGQAVVLRAILQITAAYSSTEEVALLEEAALRLLRDMARSRGDVEEECSFAVSWVASYLRGCSEGQQRAPLGVLSASLEVIRTHPSAELRHELVCTVLPAMAPFLATPPGIGHEAQAAGDMREEVWGLILKMHEAPGERREMWAALCVLYEALVEPLRLPAKTEFWVLMEQGLCGSCSLSRKRALHVLERYLESKAPRPQQEEGGASEPSAEAQKKKQQHHKHKQQQQAQARGHPVVQWWQDFTVVVQTFEMEREGHLVDQTWPMLVKLIRQVTGAAPVATEVAALVELLLPTAAPPAPPQEDGGGGDAVWYLPQPSWPWVEVALRRPLSTTVSALKKRYLSRMVDVSELPLHDHLGLLSEDFVVNVFCVLCLEAHHNRNGLKEDLTQRVATFLARHVMQLPDDDRREHFLVRLLHFCGERNWSTHGQLTVLSSMLDPCLEGHEWPCLGTEGILAARAFLGTRLNTSNSHVQHKLLVMVLALLRRFTDYRQSRRPVSYQAVQLLLGDIPGDFLLGDGFQPLHDWLHRLQQSRPEPAWLVEETRAGVTRYVMGDSNDHHATGNGSAAAAPASSSSSLFSPPRADLSSVGEDSTARLLSAMCVFLTDPADLRLVLGPSVLATLSKAQSHPYLPARRKRHALLLLHHVALLACLAQGPRATLADVLAPVADDIMAFLTATALDDLSRLLTSSQARGGGEAAVVVVSSDLITDLGNRSLSVTVAGHMLRVLGDNSRSVSDAALGAVDRSCEVLLDLNDAAAQDEAGGGDQILARIQAVTVVERVLANAPPPLVATLAGRRRELRGALLGLRRGEAMTEALIPALVRMRSSGVLVQTYSDRLWRCLALLKQQLQGAGPDDDDDDDEELEVLVPMLCNSLDTTSRRSITDLLLCLSKVIPAYVLDPLRRNKGNDNSEEEEEKVLSRAEAMIGAVWRVLGEVGFRPLACVLAMNTFFCPALLAVPALSQAHDSPLRGLFHRLVEVGHEYKHHIIVNLVARCIAVWEEDPSSCVHYAREVAELLLFKEEEPDISQLADATDEEQNLHVTVCKLPHPILRLALLYFLTRLQQRMRGGGAEAGPGQLPPLSAKDVASLQGFLDALVLQLLEWDAAAVDANSWTPHTQACNKKLRSWQALALLAPSLHQDLLPQVNKLLWPILARFSVLHVRYHVEAFVAYTVQRFPDTMWPLLLKEIRDFKLKPQVITSRLCIVGLAVFSKDAPALSPSLQAQLVSAVLPWLGSTHGYCRILTQLVTYRLLPAVIQHHEQHATGHPCDVDYLKSVMSYLTDHREIVRMRAREVKAFDSCSAAERCTYEHLMTHELNDFKELAPIHILDLLQQSMAELHRELIEEDMLPESDSPPPNPLGDEPAADSEAVLQRKIITSDLLGLATQEKRRMDNLNARGKPKQSVIVCASLVDKLPNLAGLARTCEVFAASKLIIPNTKIMEAEMFQQISAAAANHVVIEEVKMKDTGAFLRRCKAQGYAIVGLEQTSTSDPLQSVRLPRRAVLLLGQEKEGIPVDLLQEVDVVVEIPQLGITRSLNVHVSGALLLWEYTRQHADVLPAR